MDAEMNVDYVIPVKITHYIMHNDVTFINTLPFAHDPDLGPCDWGLIYKKLFIWDRCIYKIKNVSWRQIPLWEYGNLNTISIQYTGIYRADDAWLKYDAEGQKYKLIA
jgi:hypothetical protein